MTVSSDTRGNGIVTSQCSRILSTVRINQPINRVVATLVTSHLKQYHDQGLFSAIFGINLVLCALDMGSSFRSVTNVFKCISSEIVLFLKEYALSERGTETELQALLSLSRSMMSSKSLCGLAESELSLLSKLAVEVFLKTESPQDFSFASLEGNEPGLSCVVDGILIPASDNFEVFDSHDSAGVLVACIKSSVAGDVEAFANSTFVSDEECFEESIIEKLLVTADVVAQKVSATPNPNH